MRTKISRNSLFFFIYSTIVLLPDYFTNSVSITLNNVIVLLGIVFLVKKNYKPRTIILVLTLYFIVLIFTTFYNHTDMANIKLIVSNAKLIVYLSIVDYMFLHKVHSAIKILYIVISAYVIMDFASLVFFPSGLRQVENVWNEWSSSYDQIWLLGRKNNRVFWYIMLNVLTIWKYKYSRSNSNCIKVVVVLLVSTIAALIEKSSTSIVVMLIIDMATILYLLKKSNYKKIRIKTILFAYLLLTLLLLSGSVAFIQPLLENIFYKNLTFSSRNIIWQQVIALITQKPILGWGNLGSETVSNMLGSIFFTSAHNQWLNFLFQGGVVLFSVGLLFYLIIWRAISNQLANRDVFLLTVYLLAIFMNMLFEAQFNTLKVLLVLMLIYEFSVSFKKEIGHENHRKVEYEPHT